MSSCRLIAAFFPLTSDRRSSSVTWSGESLHELKLGDLTFDNGWHEWRHDGEA